MFLKSFVFTIFFYFIEIIESKYNCTLVDQVVELPADKLVFFETPNFPYIWKLNPNCSLTFKLNIFEEKMKIRGIIVLSNYEEISEEVNKFQIFNTTSMQLFNTFLEIFQGFALFDHGDDNCPLESISRVDPFEFEDETQIIYLQSTYPNEIRNHPCLWQFSAPKGYGFKFVFHYFNVISPTQVDIANSTEVIRTERNVVVNHPYYNNDNYLKISLTGKNLIISNRIELSITISIFKNNAEYLEMACEINHDKTPLITTWTNKASGYPNNAKCFFELVIPPNIEYDVMSWYVYLETNADIITYYDTLDNTSESFSNDFELFRLLPNKEGKNKTVKWEFLSDGSVQSSGFEIDFFKIICECADPLIVIDCEQRTFDMMGYQAYCAYLQCNFTLQLNDSCSYPYIKIRINMVGIKKECFVDIYKIISDNNTLLEINNNTVYDGTYISFLPSINNNMIEYDMSGSRYYAEMHMVISGHEKVAVKKRIQLSQQTPFYGFDFLSLSNQNDGKLLTVESLDNESSSYNNGIEIYSHDGSNKNYLFSFYTNESLMVPLKIDNCFVPHTSFDSRCKIFRSHFAAFPLLSEIMNTYDKRYVLIQILSVHRVGCIFQENVYFLNRNENNTISAIVNSKGKCKIFIMLDETNFLITKLWTTANKQAVKVYAGVNDAKYLFEFDSRSACIWKNIFLSTRIYIIEIPPKTAVMITINSINYTRIPFFRNGIFEIPIDSYPYQSILSSLDYGINYDKCDHSYRDNQTHVTYNVNKKLTSYSIKFTVMDYFFQSHRCYLYQKENDIKNVTHINQEIVFSSNANIHYIYEQYYSCDESSNDDGALFQIELIKNVE